MDSTGCQFQPQCAAKTAIKGTCNDEALWNPFLEQCSPCHAVALHVGADFEFVEVTPRTPATSAPEFRALSPGGRVPAFVDGVFHTDESHAIMFYLAEIKPNTLWPGDRVLRAQVMRWMSWALAHWYHGWRPLQFERFIKPAFIKGQPDESVIAQALPIFHTEAKILDDHLANRKWLVGRDLTLADFSVAAGLCYAAQAQFPLDGYKHIRNWYRRMEALPAWEKSTPRAS